MTARQLVTIALLSFASAGLLAASACGSSSAETPAGDGGATGDARADSAVIDATSDGAHDEPDAADIAIPRCPGATWVTAPSGAACVPEHIAHSKGLEGACYGPPVGDTCDRFEVSVTPGEESAVPSGFVCGAIENGVVTCRWTFTGDASFGTLDDAALEAACAATVGAVSARVRCLDFGS